MCQTAHRRCQRPALGSGSAGWLTCSGAACWTAGAGTPLVSGSARCWSGCRCDFAAPARSACSPAARRAASSAPAPAWRTVTGGEGEREGGRETFSLWFSPSQAWFQTGGRRPTWWSARRGDSKRPRRSSPPPLGWGRTSWSRTSASSPSSPRAAKGCWRRLRGFSARSF